MSRAPLVDVRSAQGISVDRDPVDGSIMIWLHGENRKVFAGIALPLDGAVTFNERLTAACRRGAVEEAAGPSPSEGIH